MVLRQLDIPPHAKNEMKPSISYQIQNLTQNEPTLLSGCLQVEGLAWPLQVQKFVRIPLRTQERSTPVITFLL